MSDDPCPWCGVPALKQLDSGPDDYVWACGSCRRAGDTSRSDPCYLNQQVRKTKRLEAQLAALRTKARAVYEAWTKIDDPATGIVMAVSIGNLVAELEASDE